MEIYANCPRVIVMGFLVVEMKVVRMDISKWLAELFGMNVVMCRSRIRQGRRECWRRMKRNVVCHGGNELRLEEGTVVVPSHLCGAWSP